MQPPLVDRESPPTCAPGEYQGCRPPADTPPAAGDGSRFPPAPPDVVLPDVVVSAPRPTMRERRKRETRSVLRTLGNIALDLILGRIRGPLGAVVRALPRRMPGAVQTPGGAVRRPGRARNDEPRIREGDGKNDEEPLPRFFRAPRRRSSPRNGFRLSGRRPCLDKSRRRLGNPPLAL